ncbi:S9 family peptidase [Halalkalirubrum salinum]|uniref:S9 family peptidase n=1 Tax=Halalkalirubrum salinum TaxID=2563889 RepID=UPI0010FAEF53|nr:prolyl oligopeptidase family serine peptidase [Halalkalirubrum salinum]
MAESADIDVLSELAQLPTMAHPVLSPGGDRIALYYDISGRNEVYVLDTETGKLAQRSDGEVPRNARWYLRWDADGDRVLFHNDDAGNEQNDIHALDADGTVEQLVEMDGQASIHDVGESHLLFGSSRDGQMNVYRYDFDTGAVTKLTEYDRAVWTSHLSPDEERIAYATNETDDYDNRDVYVADIDGSNPRNLEIGAVGAEATPIEWDASGSRLLVGDNSEDLGRIGVYDFDEDAVTWYAETEYDESPVAFLPDGDRVLGVRSRDAMTLPVVWDLNSGAGRELDVPDGVASFVASADEPLTADGRVVFQHTTPTRRPELLAYDLETDEYEVLLEAEYGPFEPEDFADATYFTVDSDGVPETPAAAIDHEPAEELSIGALLYDSGERPSPLIINPHGGPRARSSKAFNLYTQVLCARGYSVLQVNYRGSTGRGRAFVEALIDDWGGAEQGDVVVAAEHALETNEWLDDDRVAVFGGSYGGYSAYWQLVQYPSLYDAGVAWIGLTDLEEMYETTMPHFRTELMMKYLGTPEENPALYRDRSPLTHAKNLDAPLLMIHGVNDRRVPVSQAQLFRDRLEELDYEFGSGGTVEYEELGEEGHASTDQDQKLRMFRLLDEFLTRRLANGSTDQTSN